jgi:hypothetical protein
MQIERARDKKKLTEKETRDTCIHEPSTNTLRHTTQTFETALKWKRESRNNH